MKLLSWLLDGDSLVFTDLLTSVALACGLVFPVLTKADFFFLLVSGSHCQHPVSLSIPGHPWHDPSSTDFLGYHHPWRSWRHWLQGSSLVRSTSVWFVTLSSTWTRIRLLNVEPIATTFLNTDQRKRISQWRQNYLRFRSQEVIRSEWFSC